MERVLYAPRALPPLLPDVSQDPGPFAAWVRAREEQRVRAGRTSPGPNLCLVMPVTDGDRAPVGRTLRSLRGQRGGRWSLTVVAPPEELDGLRAVVRTSAPLHQRRRIRVLPGPGPDRARELLQRGLRADPGLPRALIFPGDIWAPDTVSLLRMALTPTAVVYGDEDVVHTDGTHGAPRLKPDFSPDFLLSSAYIGRPLALGAVVADRLPDLVATETAGLEHDCALAATEIADVVVHIPEVLCHRAPGDADAVPTSVRHVQEALHRRQVDATVVAGPAPGGFRVARTVTAETPVSIVIPLRDEPRLLRTCVDSIAATTGTHPNVELVLVDNGSSDPETLTLLDRLADRSDVRVLKDARPFNWAALNNAGVEVARGELLVFLNNDIEAHRNGWLAALGAQAIRPDVAAAGARLLYPDRRLQHCGLVVGLTGAAGHVLAGLSGEEVGYLHMATSARECSAVTGACLATRREVFDLLGGFDESLGVDLNDVDYCLRAARAGLRTVYEPAAELIHHESPSRGTAGGVGDVLRFVERWREYISLGDRYFNPHLTRADPSCGLVRPGEDDDWNRWYATLTMQ